MILKVATFTEQGRHTAENIFENANDLEADYRKIDEPLSGWTAAAFETHLPILFIGAAGIAVRAIAPFVKDKLTDSPVIVMDDLGKHVIPLLSGHVGGANALAEKIARLSRGKAVITTSTDVHNLFSVDVFAVRNAMAIHKREGIRWVSEKILEGEKVTICIAKDIGMPAGYGASKDRENNKMPAELELIDYPPRRRVDILVELSGENADKSEIWLSPKKVILGIGCKRGKSFEELKSFLLKSVRAFTFRKSKYEEAPELENDLNGSTDSLQEPGEELIRRNVAAIATIDLKENEIGLIELAQYFNVPLLTFTTDELNDVKGSFTGSEFVKKTTGVDNICERAALAGAGRGGKLLLRKHAGDGMTAALAYRHARILTWDTSPEEPTME